MRSISAVEENFLGSPDFLPWNQQVYDPHWTECQVGVHPAGEIETFKSECRDFSCGKECHGFDRFIPEPPTKISCMCERLTQPLLVFGRRRPFGAGGSHP
jgi:hypothetical protein